MIFRTSSKATGMVPKPIRRDLVKTTATLAATSALALDRSTVAWAKEPADAAAGTLPQIDAILRAAVSSQDVPGVVAMAATETASSTKEFLAAGGTSKMARSRPQVV
jgi:hypothetical protein